MVRSFVAMTVPSRFPFNFVAVESFEMVAIRVESSLISTPVKVVFTEVEESVVFISSGRAPPPADTFASTYAFVVA